MLGVSEPGLRSMRVVYEAENLIDAHLVKGLLEGAEIPVFVRGEYLTGALGDLPVMGLVAVCVPDTHFEIADRLVADWRADVAEHPLPPEWGAEPEPA
jgi:hypothetical protein